jgi:hypothetical protein
MPKSHKRIYTADFVLLFVSFSIPFGWTMSGFPPSIELACACWAVTLGVLLHCFLVWTSKWNFLIRLAIIAIVPVLVLYFSWEPIKKQHALQHSSEETGTQTSTIDSKPMKIVSMNQIGISEPVFAGQRLDADFAGMKISVFQIAPNLILADVNVTTIPKDVSEQVQAHGGEPFYTNIFNGKLYVASLDSAHCLDPKWIKIKVEQK